MKLTEYELKELMGILKNTPLANEKELEVLKSNAPGIYYSKRETDKNRVDMFRYTLKYEPLNDFLFKLTNWNSNLITSIHYVHYTPGSRAREHVDYSDLTCIIMLKNDSNGGDFILNRQKINFKFPGEYLIYNGNTLHEVTELSSGIRDVLVIWYRKIIGEPKSII